MSVALEEILFDLEAEGNRLERLVAALSEDQWRTPTPADGWDVATQVAHLAWTDEAATAAAVDEQAWNEMLTSVLADVGGSVDAAALAGGRVEPAQLLVRWRRAREAVVAALRAHPTGKRMPWLGPSMSATSMATARFMETWAHSHDVHAALGVEFEVTDRIRHVAHLGIRTRNFAFSMHQIPPPDEEFRVELVAPSGHVWTYGPEDAAQRVIGSAYDFCLVVTQRMHRDDSDLVATGEDADRWLSLAQCFAGPPGAGRAAVMT
ncbi:uncharacterized protein (TIGR03084 family) [Amycolatopsis sulphurea]|uniref:Uncharacterized protein (TIGR03084 family) n=1 Tax=Amycolatopsis sulphurea TaxID=76022 RepID=A0A2A9FJC5_9PSEU|nr:TIGR03084 family metal-binding protein [Amycolatopsis sulphurea]PFG51043.1 uncharacterized protein (TIGR03084 family) [Amycolatopsis sulphurea]